MTQTIKFLDASNMEHKLDAVLVELTNSMLNDFLEELVEKLDVRPDGPEVAEIQSVMAATFHLGSSLTKRRNIIVNEVDEADDFPFENDDSAARVCRLSKQ